MHREEKGGENKLAQACLFLLLVTHYFVTEGFSNGAEG